MNFKHQKVKLVAITQPKNLDGIVSADDFIAYTARVSNPANQLNTGTAPKLLKYLARNSHWSPFEMVHAVLEVKTTRDIGRQILRHKSYAFQEFSQRYAEAVEFITTREARLQDAKNRQASIDIEDDELQRWFEGAQQLVAGEAKRLYVEALEKGIAKEQARVLLPEGLTMSTMYIAGPIRSWIHYCGLRTLKHGTQKEHADIALKAWAELTQEMPSLADILT